MKENLVGIEIKTEIKVEEEAEPTMEILGSMRELVQGKRWYNEGPGRLDIG